MSSLVVRPDQRCIRRCSGIHSFCLRTFVHPVVRLPRLLSPQHTVVRLPRLLSPLHPVVRLPRLLSPLHPVVRLPTLLSPLHPVVRLPRLLSPLHPHSLQTVYKHSLPHSRYSFDFPNQTGYKRN
jgi:hypothetical protein